MIRHPGAIDERFRQFQEGLERAAHIVLSAFPLTDRTGTKVIEITNTRWDGVSKERMSAISEHKDARLKEKSIAATLLGDVTFKDNVKGIVIDRKFGYKLLQVPHITNRESFIVNGNEVQMVNQLRWRPGIYTKIKGDDTVQTTLNTSAAGSYAVILDRTTGVLRLKVGTDKKIPIISVLHALGVTDTEIQPILTDVYKENVKAAHIDKDVFSLFTLLRPYAPVTTPVEEQKSQIVGFLASKPLNPDSTKITTGNRHESITVDAIKDAIRKTLNTSKGVEKEDDIESLAFKDFYTYVDLFLDNLTRNTKLITKDISRRMAVKIHLDNVMPENIFGDRVNDFFATSEFSRYSDQNNPIDVMAVNSAVTLMGSGGIGSTHAVTNDVRQFHPSMIGVIDPVHVPEGCHDFVTQVMTSKGWVNWPEVTENTEFACLDENDILYYSKPHKLFVYDFDGELINFKSQALQFSVTPSHRMWVAPEDNPDSYRMVTAEQLYLKGTGAVWKAPIVHEPLQGDDTEFFEVPPLPEILSGHTTVLPKFNIVDWAEFLGWWLAEGSTYSKPGTYVVRVSQDLAANPEKCARIVRLLDRMGVVYNFSSERAFTISSKQLYTYLEQFGRQHLRYIPEDAFTWPLAARRAMFEAMMLGDGSGLNRTSGPLRYSSTSKRLSEDLSRLAFTLGLSSVVCHETDGRKTYYKDNYPVIIHKHYVRNLTGRFRDKSSGMVKQPYTGKVYCASVPGERLYCRKNGKGGFWSGNSSIGTTLHTTITAAHQDKRLYVRVINAKTGEVEQIPVEELMSKVVGFADQYDLSKEGIAPKALYAKVKARHNTDFLEVDPSTVEYIFSRGSNMFSTSTNLIPFLNNNSPNRQLMANKHIEQTVQLVNPDRPIVQTSLPNGATYHETLADIINPSSPVDGTVQHVSKDKIVIEDAEGKTHVVELYDDYPLKSKTLLNDESIVKRGQKVKKGQVIARNTFTKDGALSLGKNLRIAFMPWKGVNIEDGIVISDTAAKKLTSLHKHEFRVEKDDQVRVDLQLYLAQFPHQYEAVREREKRYTADGLIKRGAKVVKGDLLIPALRLLNLSGSSLTNLHKKSLSTSYQDAGETWEKDVPGEVIDVVTTRNFVKVLVKSQEPLIVGDKLSFAASGKGIVIQILNDAEMPRNKKGDPMEVLFSTPGVIGRLNPGILYEPLIGKALHKTKETYKVQNFDRNTESDTLSEVEAILKKHHVKDTDDLYDPTTGKTIPGVLNGVIHTLKLKHQVDTKISARGAGGGLPYTSLGSPKKESGESAQRVGFLDTFSLLSGGSKEVLKDMFGVKSTRNDEYWTALQLGLPLPQPKVPYVTEKLLVDLMGAGINLNQQGSKISLSPLTDKEILKISGGEIKNPDTVRAKDMGEISGGLFDMYATGGVTGQRFSHYKLAKPVLNPLMYTAVVSVGNFPTAKVMDEIMEGKRGVAPNGDILDGPGGVTGVEGVIIRLKSINVEEELKKNSQQAPLLKGTEKNKAYKRIQFLDSLKRLGLHPEEAYVNNYMAIIPPKFRKISELPDGTVSVSDPNHGYRQVMLISEKLKELQTLGVGKEHTKELESALQTAMDKHVGMVPGDKNDREFRGFIEAINGRNESKYGFLKREVLNRQQDLSARSTIIVNPKFGLDEVGLPKSMAMTIYKPFVVKGLIASGYSPVESKKLVEDGDRRAFDVLRKEMETRPVLINRAPSLHKFSIIAQRPVLVDGKAIEVNQLIMPGLNADLDGDTVGVHVPVTEAARKEAVEKLMASKYIINPRSGDIEAHPNIDAVFGVYKMTTPVGTPTKHFLNKDELITAYRSGAVEINEAVTVGDQVHCAGQFLANEMVPESNRVGPIQLNAKKQSQVLLDVARTQPSQVAAETLNKFKDAGFEHITNLGFSVSLNDLKVDKKQRDIIFNKMDERTKEVGFDIAATEATKELEKLLAASLDNNLVQATFISGASGKSGAVRQLIGAPVAIVDPKGKVVPFAIKKSYAEGHDTGTYLAGIGGSRQGLIDKGLTVADSGYLSRLLVSSNLENIISIDDCHTSQGKDVSINDPDIHDRYGATGAYRNMLLTPSVVQKIRSSGITVIKVRSPLTCQATSGVCAMCFGVLENGKRPEVGYHIGAVAAQALGERSTQMTLSAFHSGSAIGGTRVGLPRLKELLHNTEVSKGNAVLSSETGSVTNVVDAPAGGKFVYINKAKHFVPQELGVAVAQGSHVSAGDKLSVHGSIRPRDILETTGDMSRTQDVLVQELLASYGKTKFNKRIVETAVKPMTDRAQITNAGDGDRLFGVHPGEVYVKAQLDNYNIELRNKGMKQIIYTPMLLGITQIPHHSDDVVASLAHERIKEHLQKAPAIGREIDYGAGGHVLSRLGLQHFDSIDRLKRGG